MHTCNQLSQWPFQHISLSSWFIKEVKVEYFQLLWCWKLRTNPKQCKLISWSSLCLKNHSVSYCCGLYPYSGLEPTSLSHSISPPSKERSRWCLYSCSGWCIYIKTGLPLAKGGFKAIALWSAYQRSHIHSVCCYRSVLWTLLCNWNLCDVVWPLQNSHPWCCKNAYEVCSMCTESIWNSKHPCYLP